MKISVIIVNYNGKKFLKNCLDSIYDSLSSFKFEIILIDNCSKDDSVLFIKEFYPDVILIENKENLGFSKGNNLGAGLAKGEYLLLLNNDTILQSSLEKEIAILNKETSIGALGIQMLNGNGEYTCSTGFFPKYTNIFKLKNLYNSQNDNLKSNTQIKVDWIEGSFMLIPKNVWKQVNGFSEDYFMYAEDIDLCKRINDLNYKIVFYPASSYIHFGGFNSSRNSLLIKSLKTYCDKNMTKLEALLSKTMLIFNLLIKKSNKIMSNNLLSYFFTNKIKKIFIFNLLLSFLFIGFNSCKDDDFDIETNQFAVKKWVVLGNSITKHGITSYWWGDWGMAASQREKDFVHVLNSLLTQKEKNNVIFKAFSIGHWEFDTKNYDKSNFDSHFDGDEDLIIIRLGENVSNSEDVMDTYEDDFVSLIDYVKTKSPQAKIIITGNFWKNDKKDEKQRNAALKRNCSWVELSYLDIPENRCTLDTKVFGDDGKWHLISEGGEIAPGVAIHPNDSGMEKIASAIFNVIYK